VQKFRAMLIESDRGVVRLVLPFDPREVFASKRPRVRGTIEGVAFESSVGIRNGVAFVPLNRALRAKAGVAAGDTVSVVMEAAPTARK
jgi:hypothetical protein